MAPPPVVAVEIGTSKVVAIVGELRSDGRVVISGFGEHAAKGVRKGEVMHLDTAAVCARGALHAAEESGQVTIRRVHMLLSGGHLESIVNRGTVRVSNPAAGITADDVKRVMEIARAVSLPPDREVLHTICQHFCVDDQECVADPEGLEGTKLALDMLVLHGLRARLRNTVKVIQNVPMDVQDVVFSGLCSALAVMTAEQKEIGGLVIDLGGGTTDYAAYAGRKLATLGSLAVGGDHVTNDIALAFGVSIRQAEELKCQSGSAMVRPAAIGRVTVPPEVGFPSKQIGLRALDTVINARADEVLNMVKSRLSEAGVTQPMGAGVILTGGGARLKGIVELAQRVFGLPASIGIPRDIDGQAAITETPEYSAAVGLVRYAFRSGHREAFSLGSWVRGLFGG